jgi:hypothetical protein
MRKRQPRHCLRQPLVILHQPPKARYPCEIAFHHPTPQQQYEAALGLLMLDHFEPDGVFGGEPRCSLARVSLIDISELDVLSARSLNLLGELLHLFALVLVGRAHAQGEQVSQGVHRGV